MTETVEEKLSKMSGISKRLFMALSDLRVSPPQLEDALFQMASVIDATSKFHYPKETSSKKRFVDYINSIAKELVLVGTSGMLQLEDCKFWSPDGSTRTFGEIIYGIRCSSYHDPNEIDNLIHWGKENTFGFKDGKYIVSKGFLMSLLLMLISDEANKDKLDLSLFTDVHFLTFEGVNYPLHTFSGRRGHLLDVLRMAPK